ncbi:MAG: hypothetical protein KGD63_13860 [Candidatus Lokiarchaeota archaeon]|nr:hypothetical protein [Candidatus Lokiarchaeota archaeon]
MNLNDLEKYKLPKEVITYFKENNENIEISHEDFEKNSDITLKRFQNKNPKPFYNLKGWVKIIK